MLKYSLTRSKDGKNIIKIHHDFGDFKFYLIPDEKNRKSYSWTSHPRIDDAKAGEYIAVEAAKSIANFAKSEMETMSFDEMVAALKAAQRIAQ